MLHFIFLPLLYSLVCMYLFVWLYCWRIAVTLRATWLFYYAIYYVGLLMYYSTGICVWFWMKARMLFVKQNEKRKTVVFNVFVVAAVVPSNIGQVLSDITRWVASRYDVEILWSSPNILDVPSSNGDAMAYIMGAQFYRDMFFKAPVGNTIVLLPEVYKTMGTLWVPPCVHVSSIGVPSDEIAKTIVDKCLYIINNTRGGDDVEERKQLNNQALVEHTMMAGITYCFGWNTNVQKCAYNPESSQLLG